MLFPNIKAGANRYKTKRERLSFLRTLQQSLLEMLQAGFNPYVDNSVLEKQFFDVQVEKKPPTRQETY